MFICFSYCHRLVLFVDMPLVPTFCFIVAHSLLVSTSKYSVYRTLAIEWLRQSDASADPKW